MNATLPAGVAGSAYQTDLLLTGTAPFSLSSFTGALASAGLSGSIVESPASSGTYYLRVSGTLPASAQLLTGQAVISNCGGANSATADITLEVVGSAGQLATLAEMKAASEGQHLGIQPATTASPCDINWLCNGRVGAGLSALDGSASGNSADQRVVGWFVASRCNSGAHTATNAILCVTDLVVDGYVTATGQWERNGSASPYSWGTNAGYGDQYILTYQPETKTGTGVAPCGDGVGRLMLPAEQAGHWHGLFYPQRSPLPIGRYSKMVASITGQVVSSDGNPINGNVCLMLSAAADLYSAGGGLTYVNDIVIGNPKAMGTDPRIAFAEIGFNSDAERQAYLDWRTANYPD